VADLPEPGAPAQGVPILSGFARSPDRGRGLARDMRVRWALEEVGQPYAMRLLSFEELKQPAHLARQPFGQIPSYEDGGLVLFESGAIVLYLAGRHPGLLPADPVARARAVAWIFAALGTVEPPIVEREQVRFSEGDRPWYQARLPLLDERVRTRLRQLADGLGDRDWLEGAFSAGDLMMASVLMRAEGSGVLEEFPTLVAYVARARERPAYQRAFAAQYAIHAANANTGKTGTMP
jgi:glutathione S-transferase